jgi:argininosuccinate lyase
LHELTLEEMQKIERNISHKIFEVLTVENSVNSRTSFGGTAAVAVMEQIKKAQEFLDI